MEDMIEYTGFTPIIDSMTTKYGLVGASVYGVVLRHSRMRDGVCSASQERMAEFLGITRATVNKWIAILCEDGYLEDTTPNAKNRAHIYRVIGKAGIRTKIEGFDYFSDNSETNDADGVKQFDTSVKQFDTSVKQFDTRRLFNRQLIDNNANSSTSSFPLVDIESEDESDSEFRKLFDAFCEATGISEMMINGPKAVDEITKKWIPSNVTVAEVTAAAKQLQDKQYSITGPWSLTNAINMMRSSKKASAIKPAEKYKLPEDYTSEEIDDESEKTDCEEDLNWQTFTQEYVKDRRWKELMTYGGNIDGKIIIYVPETSLPEAVSRFGRVIDRFFMGNAVLKGSPP